MRLYVIRHGYSEGNAMGIYDDDPTDNLPLSEEGKMQAQELAQRFPRVDCVFVSQFLRTQQTAIIANTHRVPMYIDARLNEVKTGKNRQQYVKNTIYAETFDQIIIRVRSFLGDLCIEDVEHVAVVTHADIVEAFYNILGGVHTDKIDMISIPNCSIHEFTLDRNFK
ncbi:MAG TPA: phosphoglycerate mutase family protein [Acidobacteriota bacterium]|nr:phosphoglycerate mutase family protein [Acidobacteriota bacterium]